MLTFSSRSPSLILGKFSTRFFSSASATQSQKPDVCIVGGGPAGVALACTLAKSNFFHSTDGQPKKILLLDASKEPELQSYKQSKMSRVPEPRVVTLSPASLRLLKSIDALQACDNRFITPFYDMLVYEAAGNSYMRFNNRKHRQDSVMVQLQETLLKTFAFDEHRADVHDEYQTQMGASVENQHLLAGLLDRLKASGKCEIVKQKVVKIEPAPSAGELPKVTLDDGSSVEPKLLIGSDGFNSMTRNEYGIKIEERSYGQKGLVCSVSTLQPNVIAFQRFMKTGPLALLPLWGAYSSIVWSCPEEMCQELIELDEDKFIERLNDAFRKPSDAPDLGRIGDKILPRSLKDRQFEMPPIVDAVNTKRFSFPLVLQNANDYVGHRMALIGDAAHRVHPLAGQGLNLGFSDVAYLSNVILSAKKGGQDIGDLGHVLRSYDKQAKLNAKMIMTAIDFVKTSYDPKLQGSETLGHVLAAARNLGIDIIESSDLMKYNFMNFASGNATHPAVYEWSPGVP